jgi:hypothetical protein
MWTDASTSFGGVGVLRDSQGKELAHGQMTWTEEEHAMLTHLGVSINVLEFFTAVYFILRSNLLQPISEGQVVC